MVIDLHTWINSQAIRIWADRVGMLINIPNLAAVNAVSRKIIALGKTEDEMKQQSPLGWRIYSRRIEFVTPFDVTGPSGACSSTGGW